MWCSIQSFNAIDAIDDDRSRPDRVTTTNAAQHPSPRGAPRDDDDDDARARATRTRTRARCTHTTTIDDDRVDACETPIFAVHDPGSREGVDVRVQPTAFMTRARASMPFRTVAL